MEKRLPHSSNFGNSVSIARDSATTQGVERAFREGVVEGVNGSASLCETHLSRVFLTRERAYKFKKVIRLPFVDFTTLEQRRIACERELTLNRSLHCPFYLAVRPLVLLTNGALSIGGEGETIDWCVEMERFEERLDQMLARRALSTETLSEVIKLLVRLHEEAPPVRICGHAADYRSVIRGLERTETDGAQRLGLTSADAPWRREQDKELSRVSPVIEGRLKRGCVRRGHGDLHLANICVFRNRPLLFDALEFDERLATTDRLYDLAFLLMDLRRLGRRDLACHAMNAYWDNLREEEEGLSLLPLFMSLRASVRLSVAVEAGRLAEATAYRSLAASLLIRPRQHLIAIGGLSGAGKSALAKRLAPLLGGPAGARILRSDSLRRSEVGDRTDTGAPEPRDYSPEGRERIYALMADRLAAAARTGSSVILDATFLPVAGRSRVETAAGTPLSRVWLEASLKTRIDRIPSRRDDPSEADEDVARSQQSPPDLSKGWIRINADGDITQTLTAALYALGLSGSVDPDQVG